MLPLRNGRNCQFWRRCHDDDDDGGDDDDDDDGDESHEQRQLSSVTNARTYMPCPNSLPGGEGGREAAMQDN